MVRPVAATVLHLEGHTAEAITLLAQANQDLESVAIHIQILLSLNRLESARRIYKEATAWAEDAFLIQLCEAWIGLKTVSFVLPEDDIPSALTWVYLFDQRAGTHIKAPTTSLMRLPSCPQLITWSSSMAKPLLRPAWAIGPNPKLH